LIDVKNVDLGNRQRRAPTAKVSKLRLCRYALLALDAARPPYSRRRRRSRNTTARVELFHVES
jgi:hypothetical protein